ncbi:NACHT, LRR and PYD domains-containing protein 3-like [Neolamprologus brichardi]|uniref:NACHT, LRR and PYD domains-containing protein 3-like n=1 Tax=Neolamprologus brichardi TaxID=32507 RepID=UPI001643B68A|nr:NACHT, LRR and PYD domains-containing protein 3-like [Neolamprologus brichardi]
MERPDSPEPETRLSSPQEDRPDFKSRKLTPDERITETPDAPEPEPGPSCVSLKSDQSKDAIFNFKGTKSAAAAAEEADQESLHHNQQHQTDLDSIFKRLEENIIMFVKNELKKMQKDMNPDYSECQRDEEELLDSEEEKQRRSSREAFLKLAVNFLRMMKQEELADFLESLLKTKQDGRKLPKTLTKMYIHFLVVQTKVKNIKYDGGAKTDTLWSPESRKMVEELGKLAEASVCSGVFTQIFKEERGLHREKVCCFVHLSVQEFLAALHVHLTFTNSDINLLEEEEEETASLQTGESPVRQFYQSAVDKALKSPNGHLELFLRFLLGLSMPSNRDLLQGLHKQTGNSSQINQEAVKYIKERMNGTLSPEKSINLLHCLNELNDDSIVKEVQHQLSSGHLSKVNLSPAQWSALVFILLSSETGVDVFDLRKYSASEEALLKLLPVVKACKKAQLSGCNLTERSCEALSSILSSQSSRLRELDMSNNNFQDSGVKLLCVGLGSPHCMLETLRLSGCQITGTGFTSLATALRSNPSYLKELDLRYNHPGDSEMKLLSDQKEDPHVKLEMLCVEPQGVQWMRPGLRKYFCDLMLDPNTAHRNLKLSDDNKEVTHVEEDQLYPYHDLRFDHWPQLLCTNSLSGCCYWEVEWRGEVHVAVSFGGIRRKGEGDDVRFGRNYQSWSLNCSDDKGYYASHKFDLRAIPCLSSPLSHKVAVYVDCSTGTVSFYNVSSDKLIHLHTFNTTFTEPVYAGFRVKPDSSIHLCADSE